MRKILGALRRADERFSMIGPETKSPLGCPAERIRCCFYMRFTCIKNMRRRLYDLLAVTVDLGFGNYATGVMQEYADGLGVPLHILKTNISEIVFDIRKEKIPAPLCAKMRKGAFYEKSKRACVHQGGVCAPRRRCDPDAAHEPDVRRPYEYLLA